MRIATVVGARPQWIKAASASRAIKAQNQTRSNVPFEEAFLHTGQHFDDTMSRIFLTSLSFRGPMTTWESGGPHGQNTGRMVEAIESVIVQEKPDWALAYGGYGFNAIRRPCSG